MMSKLAGKGVVSTYKGNPCLQKDLSGIADRKWNPVLPTNPICTTGTGNIAESECQLLALNLRTVDVPTALQRQSVKRDHDFVPQAKWKWKSKLHDSQAQ